MEESCRTCDSDLGDTGGTTEKAPLTTKTPAAAAPARVGCPSCLQRWAQEEAGGGTLCAAAVVPSGACRRPQQVYTRCDVALHSTASDCWLVAHGVVYNVTEFIAKHPGGTQSIVRHAGKESSEDFDFHCSSAQKLWGTYSIGRIAPCNPGDSSCTVS